MKSPLLIGTFLHNMTDTTLGILTDKVWLLCLARPTPLVFCHSCIGV